MVAAPDLGSGAVRRVGSSPIIRTKNKLEAFKILSWRLFNWLDMNKHQLCCIGHITLDKVVTPQNTVYMPGGTAFYCSHAIRHFNDIDYALVTAVGATEMNVVEQLREMGIHITALPSKYSVYFENIYGANPDDRTQRVLAKADPFTAGQLKDIDAQIYHLGSLLADDFSLEVIKELSQKGLIAVDSQGYLREVRDSGDTYTIGYLYQRVSGAGIEEAGRFAAAMSTLKIEKSGPFNGSKEDVIQCMTTAEQMF